MIQIICGTCGTSQGYKTAADGRLTLPAAEEQRLVARGVAEYVTRPIIGPVEDGDGGGVYIINPVNVPPSVEPPENSGSIIPGGAVPFSVEKVDGHFDRGSLLQLTRQQMEQLAGSLGVDVSRCRNKEDIADLLVEVEAEAPAESGGEAPPELGAEAPVV